MTDELANILAQRTLWLLVYTIPSPVLYLRPQCGIHIFSRPPNFEQMTLIFSREANFYELSSAGLNSVSRKFQYDAELENLIFCDSQSDGQYATKCQLQKLFHKFTNHIIRCLTYHIREGAPLPTILLFFFGAKT